MGAEVELMVGVVVAELGGAAVKDYHVLKAAFVQLNYSTAS